MALLSNSDHIIYYHIDVLWSMGLTPTYFTHPDYLVVHCWIDATYLSPSTINQTGPQIYHCVKFFIGRKGYTSLGSLCNCMVAIIDQCNAAIPFVITAIQAYELPLLTNATMSKNIWSIMNILQCHLSHHWVFIRPL